MQNKKLFRLVIATLTCIAVLFPRALSTSAAGCRPKVYPFLPEIISKLPTVRDVAISPDEKEIYFSMQSYQGELSAIVFVTLANGKYSEPKTASFSGRYHDLEPFFSQDGLRLYFASDRPVHKDSIAAKDYDIWYVERIHTDSIWSKPKNIGGPINTKDNEFYPSVATSGNFYFTCDGANSKGKDDIFVSNFKNGKYATPVSMNDSINSDGYEFNAFIAPDESFILYTCYNRKGGYGSGDLYISYNKGNGGWTTAKNLGIEINSQQMDYCPFVNMKSGRIYFTSKRNKVNTTFDSEQTLTELVQEMNRYENGLSHLYYVDFGKDGIKDLAK